MFNRDPEHSCPASKEVRLKVQLAPTEYSWAERSGSYTVRGFLGPSPAQLASWELRTTESLGLCLLPGKWPGNETGKS